MQVTLKAKQVKDSVTHTPGVCLWKLLGLGDSCAFQSLLCREIFATLPYFEKRELLGIQREHFPLATSSQAFLFCFLWGLVICSGCSFFISCGNSVALPVDQTSSKLAKIITLMIKWMPWFLYFVFLKSSRRDFCPFCTVLRTFNLWAAPCLFVGCFTFSEV